MGDMEYCDISKKHNYSTESWVYKEEEHTIAYSEIKIEDIRVSDTFSYQMTKTEDFHTTLSNGSDSVDPNDRMTTYDEVETVHDIDKIKSESVYEEDKTMLENSEVKIEDIKVCETFSYQMVKKEDFCRPQSKCAVCVNQSSDMVTFDQVKSEETEEIKSGSLETSSQIWQGSELEQNSICEEDNVLLRDSADHPYVHNVSSKMDNLRNPVDTVYFECHLCGFGSNLKSNLKQHIESVHLNLKNFECSICDYRTYLKSTLQSHINSVHSNSKNFKCHLCDYASKLKTMLKSHIDSVHLHLKNYKCHLCDYASNRKQHLNNHINSVHLNLKNFQCGICDYRTNWKSSLKNHIKSVHLNLRNFKCDLCDFRSNQKSTLERHVNSVHLNLKTFKCHLCDYESNWKSNLKNHINSVHLNLKTFKCHLCDYASNWKSALKSHINSVHLNLRNFKCHLCDHAFNRKDHLTNHINTVHPNLK